MHPGKQTGQMEVNGEQVDGVTLQSYLIRWYHAPSIHFDRDKDQDNLGGYDPKGIFAFTGKGMTLAAQLLVSMDLQKLRIGSGAGIRCSFLKEMTGRWVNSSQLNGDANKENNRLSYIPARSYYFTWTPLVRLGFKMIEKENYTLLIDGTWAPCIYNFFELGRKGYWVYLRNFDLGSTWEKQIARYITWNLRVAYGFCLNNEMIEDYEPSSVDDLLSISHYISGIITQVGISIRIPGLSKCPIPGCYTQLDHIHDGKHYRGNTPFTRLW